MLRGFQGRVCDEEQERRYYQGSSERKSLFYEAEYMTALPLLPINFPTPIATRAGSIHEHFFNPEIVQEPPNMDGSFYYLSTADLQTNFFSERQVVYESSCHAYKTS